MRAGRFCGSAGYGHRMDSHAERGNQKREETIYVVKNEPHRRWFENIDAVRASQ